MNNEIKVKRVISPLKLPKSVREKLPEAQKDYEKALKFRIILNVLTVVFLVFLLVFLLGSLI